MRICLVLPALAVWSLAPPAIAAPPSEATPTVPAGNKPPPYGASEPSRLAPLDLDNLIRSALSHHPVVMAASASVGAQIAAVGSAEASRLPQISATTGFSETTSVSNVQTSLQPIAVGTARVQARQTIYDFGRADYQIARARAGVDVAEEQAREDAVNVAHAVRRAYLGWLRDRSLAELAERRLKAARRLRDQAEAFYKAGTRSRIDLTRADTALASAQADAARARLAARTSAIALEAAVGEPGSASGEPVLPPEPAVAKRSVEDLVSLGLARPDLAVAAARLRSAQAAQAGADRASYPEFRADADAGVRTRDANASPNWSLGVTLTAPLFDGFATDRARQEAAAGTEQAREDLRAARLAAEADVRTSALSAESARERLPAEEAAVRHASENLELAQGRYKAGVGSVIEVGDALVLVAGAETDLTRDRTDYHLALADLLRAVGLTGLEDDAN